MKEPRTITVLTHRKVDIVIFRFYLVTNGGIPILQWIRDFLEVYTWWEIWVVAAIPSAGVALWFAFSFLVGLPNDVARTVGIWALFALLTLGAATVDVMRRQRK